MDPDVVVVAGEGETLPAAEAAPAAEAVADAAVEIAVIEAERDVALATIQADTTAAIIEAQQDDAEDDEWRAEIALLAAELRGTQEAHALQMAELRGLVEGMALTLSTLTPPSVVETAPATEGAPVNPESTAEDGPRASPDQAAERRHRRRWL